MEEGDNKPLTTPVKLNPPNNHSFPCRPTWKYLPLAVLEVRFTAVLERERGLDPELDPEPELNLEPEEVGVWPVEVVVAVEEEEEQEKDDVVLMCRFCGPGFGDAVMV